MPSPFLSTGLRLEGVGEDERRRQRDLLRPGVPDGLVALEVVERGGRERPREREDGAGGDATRHEASFVRPHC